MDFVYNCLLFSECFRDFPLLRYRWYQNRESLQDTLVNGRNACRLLGMLEEVAFAVL